MRWKLTGTMGSLGTTVILVVAGAVAGLIVFGVKYGRAIIGRSQRAVHDVSTAVAREKITTEYRWSEFSLAYQIRQKKVKRALAFSGAVLGVAFLASAVFAMLQLALGHWFAEATATVAASMGMATFVGFCAALMVSETRGDRVKWAEKALRGLGAPAEPDSAINIQLIPFEPQRRWHHSGTSDPYFNIRRAVACAKEWMVVLTQCEAGDRGRYTIECLVKQLDLLEKWRAITAAKLNRDETLPPIKWVCFTSNTGRYCAMQDYRVFQNQIGLRKNSEYVDLLNLEEEQDFIARIQTNIDHAKPQAGAGEATIFPSAIPGLDCYWIEQGTSCEAALRLLSQANKLRAMLVRDRKRGAPIGMVTAQHLAAQLLLDPLNELHLAGEAVDARGHDVPPQ